MKKPAPKPLYLYSVSLPLILLLVIVAGAGFYFYTNYRQNLNFSQKNMDLQNELQNRIQDKKDELTTIIITEEQLNQMIKEQAVGKGIGDSTLESATAKILDDSINIDGLIADGTKLKSVIGISQDGQGVYIKELELIDAGPFASVKETLLRTFLKATIDGLIKQGDDAGFAGAAITNKQLVIYLGK